MPAPVVAAAARAGAARGATAKAAASRTASAKAAAGTGQAARQRAAIDAIKAARPAQPATEVVESPAPADRSRMNSRGSGPSLPGALSNQRGAPDWYRTDKLKAANSGGGFLLGLGVYVLALTYLRDGRAGVKALLKAKFLNQVEAR